jgi:Pyridoxal-phosphate dependent enzyme
MARSSLLNTAKSSSPIVETVDGIRVVRDDLYPGGTKSRYLGELFKHADEVVYASPCQGGAQYALAFVAQKLKKRATLFVAKRKIPHARAFEAKALGAVIVQVPNGYLNVVQARARQYCEDTGATLAPFGMDVPWAIDVIADAALATGEQPDEVWCAGGSGVLGRALRRAWPKAKVFVVMVGRDKEPVPGAQHIRYPKPFEYQAVQPPFPADPHYDAKAWQTCKTRRSRGASVLFWNVTGPAIMPATR